MKYALRFFLLLLVTVHCAHAGDDWSITSILLNGKTGDRKYQVTYPIKYVNGSVTIESDLMKSSEGNDNVPISLYVDRHSNYQVVAKAIIKNTVVPLKSATYNWLDLPWQDDAIKNSYIRKARTQIALRGGNRLRLTFLQPGAYTVYIPKDADCYVNLRAGNIEYNSGEPSMIHIEGTSVNYYGDIGSSDNGKESWDYYWNDESDKSPATRLITQCGSVELP